FILRVEDTDLDRNVVGAEAAVFADLEWLGLEPDEAPGGHGRSERGAHGPYRQSERLAIYRDHADRLVAAGVAYPCFCTPEELEAKREAALARGDKPHYDGTCRRRDPDEVRALLEAGAPASVRFGVPKDGTITFDDAVRGSISFDAAEIGDFILLRPDGVPTYNFAVVVDDALMEITHVIRGVGHLSNTPRQVLLYRALGFEPPVFAHMPTVLGPDRQKLSKRHGAQALADYRKEGYHPDAVINYLSLLSWSSPSGDEVLDRDRLVREVSLDRVGVADVVFDGTKLRWLSGKHIEAMELPDLVAAIEPFLDRERFPFEGDALAAAVAAVRSHLTTFAEINDHLDPFVGVLDAEGIRARNNLAGDENARNVLKAARARFADIDPWAQESVNAAIRAAGNDAGARGRALYEPLRLALTGREHGPPLAAIVFVLGKAAAIRLLDEAIEAVGGNA
ncbi:MAG TPA: glutamate--tRNA ligase, partial [Longimicrobiales bacterium]|nr:glutamate--tRNA ligase [Longimicrobiales bacterium]